MKLIISTFVLLHFAATALAGMCKLPGCKEPAVERSQFCERHTCATVGCNAGVKVSGLPNWAQGTSKGSRNAMWGAQQEEMNSRLVWRHCPKHMCNRICPRLNNSMVVNLFRGKTEDQLLEIFACPNERLNKGKYCLAHSCAYAKCSMPALEEWSKRAKSEDSTPDLDDLQKHEFCPQHMAMKTNNKAPREGATKETCSEHTERVKAEKAAAAAKAAEAAAAREAARKAKQAKQR